VLPAEIKRHLPQPIKHPLRTFREWYWEWRRLPAQNASEIALFKGLLTTAGAGQLRVFEWGTGNSTIFYPKFLRTAGVPFEWFAVDNSQAWHQRGSRETRKAGLDHNVHLFCREFPAFWDLPGYSPEQPVPPVDEASKEAVRDYVEMPREVGGRFNVILADGRYRRRCLLVARDVLAPEGTVVLHDAQRLHYHLSLTAFPRVESVDAGKLPGGKARSAAAPRRPADNEFTSQPRQK
jgi:hypothetical protein